ncbi:hypothetical protein ES705_50030 [subsurface metagenome]
MLFQGLCREAGIPILDAPRERRMREPQVREPKSTADRRSAQVATTKEPRQDVKELVFGISEDDIGVLNEEEFDEVWSALGKVARARARAKQESQKEQVAKEDEKEKEERAEEDIPF